MEHKAVLKTLKFFGIVFMGVSIIELVFALLIGLAPVNINNKSVLLATILLGSGILPLEGTLFWIFLMFLVCCFLILGFALYKLSSAEKLDVMTLTKYLSILGMLILIMTLIKIEYIVLLQKTVVDYTTGSDPATFQSFLENFNITPIYAAVLWICFLSISCGYLVIGLVISAGALKFQIEIERNEGSTN